MFRFYLRNVAADNQWKKRKGVVYSTNPDFSYRVNDSSGQETLDPSKQNLQVLLDRSYRKGKEVTLVKNFVGTSEDADVLCKKLKVHCGAGGSVKDGEIIVQGNQREKVRTFLIKGGYRVR